MSKPINLSAFAAEHVKGNPFTVYPNSAVANSFPGLEIDAKNIFVDAFVGFKVDAFFAVVTSIQDAGLAQRIAVGTRITRIDDIAIEDRGWNHTLADKYRLDEESRSMGGEVTVTFEGGETFSTRFNRLIVDGQPIHSDEGQLGQSLCSPWQHDFKECACHYWAASRPDMVVSESGTTGQDWLRSFSHVDQPDDYKNAQPQENRQPQQLTYPETYHQWQKLGIVRKKVVSAENGDAMLPVEENRELGMNSDSGPETDSST